MTRSRNSRRGCTGRTRSPQPRATRNHQKGFKGCRYCRPALAQRAARRFQFHKEAREAVKLARQARQ